ncbi:MAG: hypothetical protein KJ957_08030 [Candidatus Omnitrophica bacterium]|nr:hypothetical protein [Candidatus Omnitrophota bacterium]
MGKCKVKVAVLGADGFLGAAIFTVLSDHYDTEAITRSNYYEKCGKKFDLFVNANGNSRRYWANSNAYKDFEASTISVYQTMSDFTVGYYVYISSSDVYASHCDKLSTVEGAAIFPEKLCSYGFHKYLSELIVKKHAEKYLILRNSAMVGENMKKGPLWDALCGEPLFVTLDTKLQFISTRAVGDIIVKLFEGGVHNDTFNAGGSGTFSFAQAEDILQKKLVVRSDATRQIYEMNIYKLREKFNLKSSYDYVTEFLTSLNCQRSEK